MKILLTTLFMWVFGHSTMAQELDAEIQKTFAEAAQLYDSGQFIDAAQRYESIKQRGYVAKELFYNLGNAHFKQGNIGQAVLNYRRAWLFKPRDPDVAANLHFALQSSNAAAPAESMVSAFLSKLNLAEWIVTTTTFYWLALIAAALHIFAQRRRFFRQATLFFSALLIISVSGMFHWYLWKRKPEVVITASTLHALYAPLENSTPHFALPPGSLVHLEETSGPWIKISSGQSEGWIPRSSCEQIYPWQ